VANLDNLDANGNNHFYRSLLANDGNFIDDGTEDRCCEWIQSFAYYDDIKAIISVNGKGKEPSEENET
jgi:hypothetical protein